MEVFVWSCHWMCKILDTFCQRKLIVRSVQKIAVPSVLALRPSPNAICIQWPTISILWYHVCFYKVRYPSMHVDALDLVTSFSDFPLRLTSDTVTFLGGSKEYG